MCRECLIKFILMRVPIENGLGLSTRVSDSIKLPAAYWKQRCCTCKRALANIKLSGGSFFVATKNMINIFSPPEAGYFFMIAFI